jgi:phage baseplate assembly protein W
MTPAWQIMPDPITSDVFSASQSTAQTGRSVGTGVSGRGVVLPFRRNQKTDFTSGEGGDLVRSAVGLVLGTICGSDSTQGELPWRTEFGSLLHLLRTRNNSPALAELARYHIAGALTRWVPSVRLRSVLVTTGSVSMMISIRYDVVDPVGAKVLVPGLETSVPVG